MKFTEKGMVQNVKKLLMMLLAAAAILTFVSCNDDVGGNETGEDTGNSELASVVDIVKDGASEYIIMRSDNAPSGSAETKAAIALRAAIKAATGVELTMNTDWDKEGNIPTDTKEILIGATNRPESLDPALLRPGRFPRGTGRGSVYDQDDRKSPGHQCNLGRSHHHGCGTLCC